jgi:tetratricopeptide (TPR) repeat protein
MSGWKNIFHAAITEGSARTAREPVLNSRQNRFHLPAMADLKPHLVPLAILLLITALTYSEVLTHTFLINWDDQVYITRNQAIRGFSPDNLRAAFTQFYSGNYAPVQIMSYMLDFTIWGGNPFGYLLANLCYHFLSGVLLYVLLLRQGFWAWAAVIGSAVFLVHPVQVESVAWMSQRKNLLAMLFYLLSFHAYLSYRTQGERRLSSWYLLSVGFYLLALLSKSVAVVFPLMLVMFDHLVPPLRRGIRCHADKIPYIAAAAIAAALALISQDSGLEGGRVEYPANAVIVLTLTMLPVMVAYLKLLIWPVPSQMSIMYFPPYRSTIDGGVLLALFVAVCLIGCGIYLYRKDRPALFWYLLFFLGLLPVSQIVPLVTLMNDRYLYFPMLGVAGGIAYSLNAGRLRSGDALWWKGVLVAAAVVLAALSIASYQRGRVWQDSVSLFSDAVEKSPRQSTTWSRLAEGYLAAGDLKRARSCYEKAAGLGRMDFDANYNYVQILFEAGEYDIAYRHIWGMLLGVNQSRRGLLLLGQYHYRTGNYAEAEKYLQMFLTDYPGAMHGLYALGQVYLMSGSHERAGDLFLRTIAAGGDHPGLFISIACNEFERGQPKLSLEALKIALRKGLSENDLLSGEKCVEKLRDDPRFRQIVQQAAGR